MNWAVFAMTIGLLAAALITLAAKRGDGSKAGYLLAVPLLVVVTLNGAAPVRAIIDPDYAGYSFGLFSAERGLPVTLMAGTTIVASLVAAYVAVSRRSGRILLVPAVVSGALACCLGAPMVNAAVHNPAEFKIQLGEYLTIPGLLAFGMLFLLLVLPFVLGSIWSTRRAMLQSR